MNEMPWRRRRRIEQLESRRLLAATGLLWGNDERLSLSFVPDGTDVGDHESSLFEAFSHLGPASAWQETIQRGFQTWAQLTNVDLALADDDGSPLGTVGATTGDSRFGDIRIAAIPMDTGLFATSIPTNQFIDGSWVGDVFFNTRTEVNSLDELFAIAVHEAGHVFGVEHSMEADSPMFQHGIPESTELTSADVLELFEHYSARLPDRYESPTIVLLDETNQRVPGILFGNLHVTGDADEFVLQRSDAYKGQLTIRLLSEGISLVRPTLELRDVDGRLLAQSTFDDRKDGLGQLLYFNADELAKTDLTMRVTSQAGSPYDVGGYTLLVHQEKITKLPPDTPNESNGVGHGTGVIQRRVEELARSRIRDLSQTATQAYLLEASTDSNRAGGSLFVDDDSKEFSIDSGHAPFIINGAISTGNDQDVYAIDFPDATEPNGGLAVSLVSLSKNEKFAADLMLSSNSNSSFQPLVRNDFEAVWELDVGGETPALEFTVSSDPNSQIPVGNYQLVVRRTFDQSEANLLVTDALSNDVTTRTYHLRVNRTQLFQFGISADHSNVGVSITAQNSDVWGAFDSDDGFQTHTVLLSPGDYTVEVALDDRSMPPEVTPFSLVARAVDEPLGPEPIDPTEESFCGYEWIDRLFSCLRVAGDINGDGQVDFSDFLILSFNFGQDPAEREDGDLNDDQVINFEDLLILSHAFGKEPVFESERVDIIA